MAVLGRNIIFTALLIGLTVLIVFQFSSFQGTTGFRKRVRTKIDKTKATATRLNSADTSKEHYAELNEFQGFVKRKGDGKKVEKLLSSKIQDSSRELEETKAPVTGTKGAAIDEGGKHTESTGDDRASKKSTTITVTHSNTITTRSNSHSHEKSKNADTASSFTTTVKSTITPETKTKPTIAVENAKVKRGLTEGGSYCGLSFDYGEMCPPSYVELGGKCDLSPEGFDCPDIRNKSTYSHRQGQLVTTRMLRIFDLIAKRHKINYWLTSGTLLGAARHRGNIPWDTDNDIDMPLEDYIKFFEVGAKDLPSDVFLQNSISDPFLHPSDKKYAKSITHPKVGIYQRSWNPRFRDPKSCYKYCISYGCKWHDGMMIDIFVKDGDTKAAFPLKQMDFEGFPFPVPNNWKEQLASSYGKDFMKVPSEKSKRVPVDFPDVFHSCKELGGN